MGITCKVASCAYKRDHLRCLLKSVALGQDGECLYQLEVDYDALRPVEHWNVFSVEHHRPDGGRCNRGVYCRMAHQVTKSLENCYACPLLSGVAQGNGVECMWDDALAESFVPLPDPKAEYLRVDHLIAEGILGRNPVREGKVYPFDVCIIAERASEKW